ncbi:MAG: hypothetical protein JO030_04740, partial [Candidatus Eremiobacteraeota bacterium]|nr:hypothetical protein [Candidatus Eremiobacteraeota bacterium]
MRRKPFLGGLLAAAGAPSAVRAAHGAADLIVTASAIHTADDQSPTVEAFAVRGGRFVYAGQLAGALALRGADTT